MSIFQKTFVFLHHLCTSGAKSAKNSSVQEPCKIKNKKQDEDITDFTTRQNEVAPLGTAAVADPRHPYQDDSSLGSYLHLPGLSRLSEPLLAHLGHLVPLPWAIFSSLSASPGSSSILSTRWDYGRNCPVGSSFLLPRAAAIQEKGGFRKGDRISAVGICMVLCSLGD